MSDLISQNLNMIFKTPKGETVHALKDLNFTIKKGELLTGLGPSGCGKTTLLNITAGFIRPTSGKITLGKNEINGPGGDRGMVFQQGALFEWLTVAENVNFGLRMKKQNQIETQKIFHFKHGEFVYPLTKQLFLYGKKNKFLNNKINLKILLILFHGTKDKSVPINVSKKIFKICNKSKKKLIKIKNGSHSLSRKQDLKKICSELSNIIRG